MGLDTRITDMRCRKGEAYVCQNHYKKLQKEPWKVHDLQFVQCSYGVNDLPFLEHYDTFYTGRDRE